MYIRQHYLSPDVRPTIYQVKPVERRLPSPNGQTLARYSSARYLHQPSLLSSVEQEASIKKRIENYTYRLSDSIGHGYTSKVYRGSRDGSSEMFAIKVVDLKKYTSKNRYMLYSEVTIVKTLDHPNVIKCHDVFITPNNCYIITEYCEGGDLSGYMKKLGKGRQVEEAKRNQIMKDVLSGYKYLSDKGIVHRDIKPANIFIKSGRYKIADFGFAKYLADLKIKYSYNVGTPLYMPPYALLHNRYSQYSDIFSIGVMFYELVYSSTPWESRTEKELINKMMSQPLKIGQEINQRLREVLEGCLKIQVYDRWSLKQILENNYVSSVIDRPYSAKCLSPLIRQPIAIIKHMNSYSKSTTQYSSSQEGSVNYHQTVREIDSCQKITMDKNTHVIIVQLNFCRFMYYLIRNRISLLRKIDKDRLGCVLYRHILQIIDKLQQLNKNNEFRLTDFEKYKNSNGFYKIYGTIVEYAARYRKEYEIYREKMPWQYMDLVDSYLNFMKGYDSKKPDRDYYKAIANFVRDKIRQLNHNISYEVRKSEHDRDKGTVASIEALKNLIKYLNLLDMASNNFEDYDFFAHYSSITVVTDYSKSTADISLYNYLKEKAQLLTM